MRNRDITNLRREKLRNLLQQEMEEYQYEIYSNNGSQSLLDKLNSFNNYNNKNKTNIDNSSNINNNIQNDYTSPFMSLYNTNINNINMSNQNIEDNYMNQQNNSDFNPSNNIDNNNNNNINNNNDYYSYNQINNNFNNYGNVDLDAQINNYNAHYNKLRVDEFMSKKMIQDDLLNKINQKLMKINKDINDKVYQENLAAQWRQNHQNQQ